MLVKISGDRFVNPLSPNIIEIVPNEDKSYQLYIGCPDGISSQSITSEDRDLIVKAMESAQKQKKDKMDCLTIRRSGEEE
jgi:hypothetical protein